MLHPRSHTGRARLPVLTGSTPPHTLWPPLCLLPISSCPATSQPLMLHAPSSREFSQLPIWAPPHGLFPFSSCRCQCPGAPGNQPGARVRSSRVGAPSQVLPNCNHRNSSCPHREPMRSDMAPCSVLVTASGPGPATPGGPLCLRVLTYLLL